MRGPYRARPPEGSFADLIQRFRQSPRYRGWAPSTRAINDRILGDFQAANGRALVAEIRRGDVLHMRDSMSETPGAANNWMKVVRALLDYAVDLEMIPVNPARQVKRLPPAHREGFRTWREDEIAAFLDRHRLGTTPHLAMTLMLYTAAARVDVVRLGPSNIRGDRICYKRIKTARVSDVPVTVPILPPLAEALRACPPRMTYLETARGRPRSANSLTGSMAVWVRMAGLEAADEHGRHLNCHGLRKAMGRRLAEAGCTPHQIMAWLGHTDLKQVTTYTAAMDRARSADDAAERLGNISGSGAILRRLKTRDNTDK